MATRGSDVAWTLERLHRRYGPVVDFGYRFPIRAVCLFGPEANKHLLADNADNFLWAEAFRLLEVVDGPTALVMSDGDEHRRRRRLVQPAFAVKRVDAHLDLIVAELDRTLAGWHPGRRLDAHAELRAAVRRIVVRALFGDQMGAVADEIGDRLEPALRYVQRTPLSRFDVDLRWNGYGRARAAASAVDELILGEIARRRREGVDAIASPDTLSALLVAADEVDGGEEPLADAELCDQIRSLIAAGYDTTSSAAGWLVHALGSNQSVLAALRNEVRDTIGDRAPTVDDLRAMPLVDGVVRETLRLWPPGVVSGRTAIDDFEVLGYRIAGGSTVLYSPYITHRLPEVWGDPEEFRPERWQDGEPVPYSFVPFGGGYRKCIGFSLATLELQVLAVRLAQQVSWTLDQPTARPSGVATFVPKGGVPITIAESPIRSGVR
jgi:cytochrome P450